MMREKLLSRLDDYPPLEALLFLILWVYDNREKLIKAVKIQNSVKGKK